MPGKLPGGKVRISQSAPSIIKKTKNPATSEVQYFGLVRDLYLEDLTSNKDALKEVLRDIQDPAERKAEGEMKIGDLSIIDGIVDSDVKKEDLQVLSGASLSDEEGGTLVNPRYRLSDRISQFATFAGRGIQFAGAGPVKFTYLAPLTGDLLEGTVSIATSGVVTGSGTSFDTDSGLNRTLAVGDFVSLYEEDGVTLHKTGATAVERAADDAIYKVTNVASDTSITLSPSPGSVVTAGKKLRKRYSHSSPPPFFKEAIDSTNFNSADAIPSSSNYVESHRLGFLRDGQFKPEKGFEDWWEGAYNHEFRLRSEYGGVNETAETNPKFPIVKDGNINFELSVKDLPQEENIGFRYDFLMRKSFTNDVIGATFTKFIAQVNGHIKIDYYEQTGFNADGSPIGTWKTALDTTNSDTFFTETNKETPATNRLGIKERYIQGGPDFRSNTSVAAQSPNNSLDLSATFNDEEGNAVSTFDNSYFPVVIRYWYGQNTIDNSSTPISELDAEVNDFTPSFAVATRTVNLPSANLQHLNGYAGALKLTFNATDSRWNIASSSLPANYDANSDKFAHQFEVLAYSALNVSGDNAPPIPAESGRNVASIIASALLFENTSDLPLIADRYDNGSNPLTNNELVLSIPGVSPANGDVIYILGRNRPFSITPTDVATRTTYDNGGKEIFAAQMFNPDPIGNYVGLADMLPGGTNFIEPNPVRNEFEDNAEYFKYKFGIKPGKNTYGPARYDGFIKNRVSSLASDYDTDYTHTKILPIGRQRKSTVDPEPSTNNPVTDPKALSTDVTPTEVRSIGENYTFISVEADEAGNGGEVNLMGFPVNTLAAITGTAGQADGGRILHNSDNNATFSSGVRQNISSITVQELPVDANFDDDATYTYASGGKGYSLKYASINTGAKLIIYPARYNTKPDEAEAYDSTTRGMISSQPLGVNAVAGVGTNGRSKSTKSVFFTGFKKNSYGNDTTRDTEEERFFIDFLLGTRPNIEKTINIGTVGTIEDADLWSNFSGAINSTEGRRLYDGALIEFYADSDALANSGEQVAGSTAPVAIAYVNGYDATTTPPSATYVVASGTAPGTGAHSVRVYYNYLEITKVPAKNTNSAGIVGNTTLSGSSDGSTMQMRLVYNSSYGLSKADTGSGLSFAETLYVKENTTAPNPQLQPFDSQTELPSPPSVTVTPFGFDNQPTDPNNPGLGGLCYPPYSTQDIDLKLTAVNDATLYASSVGEYDVYFGSPQISSVNLGNKFLQVTDEFAFDFSEADRPRVIPADLTAFTLPTFTTSSYTHKLRVNLNPFIGAPGGTPTGLYSRPEYTGVTNDNIFKDALVHSNNKPVKETFFLFAKKASGDGEVPISILTDNNPGYT